MRFHLLFALTLAGCFAPTPRPEAGPLAEEAFDRAGAPWALVLGGGCGFCPGWRGFDNDSEGYILVVFENGRVLRADLNGGWGDEGEKHLAPGVTYDRAELIAALAQSDRARGETWVHRVHTARLAEEGAVARMLASWDAGAPDSMCTDTGFDVVRREPAEHVRYTCGPESGAMSALTRELFDLAQAMPGNGTRQGMPGEGAY